MNCPRVRARVKNKNDFMLYESPGPSITTAVGVWTDFSRSHSKRSLRNVFITNVLSPENITIIWYISASDS